MSTDLMTQDQIQGSKYGTEIAHKNIAGSSFLPRLQLCQASANLCKKGKVPIGSYAILRGKDAVVHLLGDDVDMLVVSWRPKAIRFGEKTIMVYNPALPAFKQIEIDAQKSDSGCLYGPEYLVYVPTVNEFATFHFNNATARVAASGMIPNVGKAVTCRVEYIEKGKNSWHGPVVLNCSTPLQQPADMDTFNSLLISLRDKFNNPKEEELEEAPATETSDRAR